MIACPDSPKYAPTTSRDMDVETQESAFHGFELHRLAGTSHESILHRLRTLTEIEDGEFPGSQPVSVDKKALDNLKGTTYVCAEKTDGIRVGVFFTRLFGKKLVLLFDRHVDGFYLVSAKDIPRSLYQDSVFDGELVRDVYGKPYVLIFDAYIVSGVPVFMKTLDKRLYAVERGLAFYNPCDTDTVVFNIKRFVPFQQHTSVKDLHDERFQNDGFIFAPLHSEYVVGRHDSYLKLKSHHTVDLKYVGGTLYAFDTRGGKDVNCGRLQQEDESAVYIDGTILECDLVTQGRSRPGHVWKVFMVRDDKSKANSVSTMTRTIGNIKEHIQFEDMKKLL